MTDRYAYLRAALNAGPTPGPWRSEMVYDAGYAHINFDSREWNTLRGFCGEANAVYIAVANPDTIRALLADYDRMRDALIGAVAVAREAHAHWDADRDTKVGKLLLALSGYTPGYDPRTDSVHAALAREAS